jgi:hypothetical protein
MSIFSGGNHNIGGMNIKKDHKDKVANVFFVRAAKRMGGGSV